MLKTNLILDPVVLISANIEHTLNRIIARKMCANERQIAIAKLMRDEIISWDVENDGGVYSLGLRWWGHGRGDEYGKDVGILTLEDIKFALMILAEGAKVSATDFEKKFLSEVRMTTILNPKGSDHGMLFAGFNVSEY